MLRKFLTALIVGLLAAAPLNEVKDLSPGQVDAPGVGIEESLSDVSSRILSEMAGNWTVRTGYDGVFTTAGYFSGDPLDMDRSLASPVAGGNMGSDAGLSDEDSSPLEKASRAFVYAGRRPGSFPPNAASGGMSVSLAAPGGGAFAMARAKAARTASNDAPVSGKNGPAQEILQPPNPEPAQVPEPETILLVGGGMAVLMGLRIRAAMRR